MTKRVVWEDGGEAELVSLTGESVRFVSSVSFPPGARPWALIEGLRIRVKVHASRKTENGFTVEGRCIDLRKEMRETLERLLCDDVVGKP